VPERIQGDADPATLAADVLAWLDAPARMAALEQRFTELHHLLRRDTARTASDAIAQVLGLA
jgi:lipid-A-disaccharide synthase